MYLDTISQIHDIIVETYHVIMFVITILDYNIIILDSGYDIIIVCNCSTHDSSCFHSSVIMYYVRLSDLPCTSTWSCPAPAELTICTINSSCKLAFANHSQVQFVLNHWKDQPIPCKVYIIHKRKPFSQISMIVSCPMSQNWVNLHMILQELVGVVTLLDSKVLNERIHWQFLVCVASLNFNIIDHLP